jgi:hypothetical protein
MPLLTNAALRACTALVIAGSAVVGVSTVAEAATPTAVASSSTTEAGADAPSSSDSHVRDEVRAVMHALPAQLKKDVRAAEAEKTRTARHDALTKIAAKGASGEYGATVKAIIAAVQADTSLPKSLQHRVQRVENGRHTAPLREARWALRRILGGKAGAELQKTIAGIADGLPKAPMHRGQPSDTSGR